MQLDTQSIYIRHLVEEPNLKKCIIKGDNWSVKGPAKNLYSYTGGGMPSGNCIRVISDIYQSVEIFGSC